MRIDEGVDNGGFIRPPFLETLSKLSEVCLYSNSHRSFSSFLSLSLPPLRPSSEKQKITFILIQ